MQKKLLRLATSSPNIRHLEIRWLPTHLRFPFSNKPVLGCLIGFNLIDRYEVFDEENVILALQKYLPELRLVKESSYCPSSEHKRFKTLYFEIEKKNGIAFSLSERSLLKNNLEEKVKKSIQPLSPTIFMSLNDEEINKNILILSQEVQSIDDLPQVFITLDQQTGKEIIFRINLVYISPIHRFSLKDRFFKSTFVSERTLIAGHIENYPIEAHIFRLHLLRDSTLLRADGSLDFYSARQKIVSLITNAIGEFRDYNGGILIKQQELLQGFKEKFPDISNLDPELIEAFFYGVAPLEKQAVLPLEILTKLFDYFLQHQKDKLPKTSIYSINIDRIEQNIFLAIQGINDTSFNSIILAILQEQNYIPLDIAYTFLNTSEGIFFNCVLTENTQAESFVQTLQDSLQKWHKQMRDLQVLRIGLEHPLVSLDPRRGGETSSGDVLKLLFEGLTRFNQNGQIENAIATSIEISPNMKQYVFKLRPCLWNDGSSLTAYDFEYAWKKVLSPDFKTPFAYMFYPIKNAKEAKEGQVSMDQIGIEIIDDRTIKVELVNPTSYFLQLTAHVSYSPIHRFIDQQHPQWPYECEKNYPCNGAYQLKMNEPNQGYRLIKNSFFWDASNVALDQITFTQLNPTQALQAFDNNEIDWIGNPFGNWHASYEGVPSHDENVISFPNSWVCWFVFNTTTFPFQNKKLRQAFGYAIQRAQIIKGTAVPLNPAYTPLLPHFKGNLQSQYPDYHPEMARKLFSEGLEELGIGRKELPPFSLVFYEKGVRAHTALCLRDQFKECLDIDCELKPLLWTPLFHMMTKGEFQMGLMQWHSLVNDPSYTLNSFVYAKQDTNFAKWEHPDFQSLIHLSEQETNPFQRSTYLLKAEAMLSQEMPVVPLYYQPYKSLIRKDSQMFFKNICRPINIAFSDGMNTQISKKPLKFHERH